MEKFFNFASLFPKHRSYGGSEDKPFHEIR